MTMIISACHGHPHQLRNTKLLLQHRHRHRHHHHPASDGSISIQLIVIIVGIRAWTVLLAVRNPSVQCFYAVIESKSPKMIGAMSSLMKTKAD